MDDRTEPAREAAAHILHPGHMPSRFYLKGWGGDYIDPADSSMCVRRPSRRGSHLGRAGPVATVGLSRRARRGGSPGGGSALPPWTFGPYVGGAFGDVARGTPAVVCVRRPAGGAGDAVVGQGPSRGAEQVAQGVPP